MIRPSLIAAAVALLLAAGSPGPAGAVEPRASLPDIEDEVMCTVCGTLLELSEAPQAERQRALIRKLIEEGKTKEEIKGRLVAEYGSEVLATPGGKGFDLVAWLAPAIAIAVLSVSAIFALRRHRRGHEPPDEISRRISPSDSQRLNADLAHWDEGS